MLNRTITGIALVFIMLSPAMGMEIDVPFRPVPNTPYFESPRLTVDAIEHTTLVLRIKSEQSGTARVLWATHYDPQFNIPKSIWFYLKAGEHDYYFNIPSQNPSWMGWITGFLLFPDVDPSGIEIKQAKVMESGFLTNIRSGWREFWGPNGREVVGSTINVTPASTIFGRPVNVYIYWLTGIFFAAMFAWKRSFYAAGRYALYFALAAWVLLGLNADYNYFNIFRDNFGKYFGRSIEEKHAIAYGQDYYDFLVFAKEKLPAEPVHFGVLSSRYAPDLQPRIFLVPHVLVAPDSPKADYLLVFAPKPDQLAMAKGFRSYAQLDKSAYILKKRRP